MPFIPVPGGVKVCMRFTKAGQQVCNVFYVDIGSEDPGPLLPVIGSVFKNWWLDNLQNYATNDVSLQAVEVSDASTSGGLGIEYVDGLPQPGTAGTAAVPNNVTVATKLTTGHMGRSYRGRSYFIGLNDANLASDKQHITPATQSALDSAFDALISALITEGVNLAIASLYSGVDANHKPIPRGAGILTPVIGASTNLTLDSQRRRLPERGA